MCVHSTVHPISGSEGCCARCSGVAMSASSFSLECFSVLLVPNHWKNYKIKYTFILLYNQWATK